jgi:hypothetical protein
MKLLNERLTAIFYKREQRAQAAGSSPAGPASVGPSRSVGCMSGALCLRRGTALAPVLRQGCVDLGVGTGRGLSSASGSAEAQACEMPVYLCTRKRFGH